MRSLKNSKMAGKILIFGILMIVVSVTVVSGFIMTDSSIYNAAVSNERVASALDDLSHHISDMLDQSGKSAVSISQNYLVIDAVENNDFDALKAVLYDLNSTIKMDTISITDTNGDIIIRQHQPDKYGDNILNQTNVQKALEGESATTLEPGALVKLSTRSGMPIYNHNGRIIGTVVTGYTFENSAILDELKTFHNMDFTIFSGNERIATTIINNGQRVVGTALNDTITKIVIKDGQPYSGSSDIFGTPYITKYEPLLDTNGKIVGAIFAGLSETNANASITMMLIHILIVLPIVIIICAVVMILFINKNIREPMQKLTMASDMLAHGDLDITIDQKLMEKKDEIGGLANAFNLLITSTKKQVEAIRLVSQGDLTINIEMRSEQDFLGKSLGVLVENLNELTTTIFTASEQVSNGSNLVSNSSMVLSQGATEQASSVQQLSASIEEVAAQTNRNAHNAEKVFEITRTAKQNASDGNKQMKDMLTAMADIDDSSGRINRIIKVIDDIAFQTNILALNAAVEAARAGQHGKGFAVVAEEVRTLAAKSASAAKETTLLIENSINKVGVGNKIANDTAFALEQIVIEVNKASDLIGSIVSASHEQAKSIEQINVGVIQVSQVVQTNAATAEESAAASEELAAQAEQLKQTVSVFKTKKDSGIISNTGIDRRDIGTSKIYLGEKIMNKQLRERETTLSTKNYQKNAE